MKLVTRKDWQSVSSSYICKKHFEAKTYKQGEKHTCYYLIKKLKPVPTIFDSSNFVIQNFISFLYDFTSLYSKKIIQETCLLRNTVQAIFGL